ncbi:hypothetical protein KSP39_PZI009489 [Platanthera zijinensis]|uniref:Uncharacterized protein n=1 Tax=Platanthera zijinensis TaxID=2320716 RepID=A0AAP0G784_9ASPA
MIIGGDSKKTIQVLFDESSSKSMTVEGCQFNASQLTSLLFNSHETSNELLPSNVCISQYDDTCANVKVDDSNSYSLSGENLSLCNAASPQTNSPKLINSVSEEIMVDTKAITSLLISHGECRIPENVHVDNSEKNSLELHFDYEEHSSDSTIDTDRAIGLEKVDLLGDDDSQYEDGELRESILNSCGEDEAEHVNCRFDISGNSSSPKFPLPGSRNAVTAAIVKVESNGFVVAPDETVIIDSDGDFHMLAEVSNSRNVSPGKCFNAGRGRDSRYGSRLFSPGHANRYHSPILDSMIDSQSLQHSSSIRQHSFSPHRRPPHLARELTRSPSRSRTRSPHTWTSPRARNDRRISAIHNMKRQSRSPPNFKPQRRIPTQRSPQYRGGSINAGFCH